MHSALITPRKPSSAIAGYLYLPSQQKLIIAFTGGGTGAYADVGATVAAAFINAGSLGTYLAANIKGTHAWTACDDVGIDALIAGEQPTFKAPPTPFVPRAISRIRELLALDPTLPRLI
jgi:hypothetical protein